MSGSSRIISRHLMWLNSYGIFFIICEAMLFSCGMRDKSTRVLSSGKFENTTRVFMSNGFQAMHQNSTPLNKSGRTSRDIAQTNCFSASKTSVSTYMPTQSEFDVHRRSYDHSSFHPSYLRLHGDYTLLMRIPIILRYLRLETFAFDVT